MFPDAFRNLHVARRLVFLAHLGIEITAQVLHNIVGHPILCNILIRINKIDLFKDEIRQTSGYLREVTMVAVLEQQSLCHLAPSGVDVDGQSSRF